MNHHYISLQSLMIVLKHHLEYLRVICTFKVKIIYLNFIIWEMTCQAWFVSLGQFYGFMY